MIAVRDVLALTVVAFLGATAVEAACTRVVQREYAAHTWLDGTPIDVPFVWSQVAQTGWQWSRDVVVWVAVCWCATRARAQLRTVWLPATAGLVAVGLRTALPLLGVGAASWSDLWPGPATPYSIQDMWDNPTALHLVVLHPAWGFPLLLAALVVAAAVLGAHAGRRPDDASSHPVAPVSRVGALAALVVVGLPALGATAGAMVARHATGEVVDPLAGTHGGELLHDVAAPLVLALVAVGLLSGAGIVGGVLAAVVTAMTVVPPLLSWMAAQVLVPVWLGVPAGITVACAAIASWRPAALWSGGVLAPALAPARPIDVAHPSGG
ncbi:MAG: hypothetical protein J0I40_07585 [Cellulomonas sp.]|nr:hypothetical protein [Cellulomonas sp.]